MTPRRVDANQKRIVEALRRVGCSVQSLASIGKGCPDLLVGLAHKNFLMEIKNESLPASRTALTKDEEDWFFRWRGQCHIVFNVQQALRIVGL